MQDLLLKLKEHNIDIQVEEGSLKLKIPGGLEASDLVQEIKNNKEELVAYITQKVHLRNEITAIGKAPARDHYALSSAQKRLYFIHEFDKRSLAYHLNYVVQIEGKLDKRRLQLAFEKLVARHESFRTFFDTSDGTVVQKIADTVSVSPEYYDGTGNDTSSIVKKFMRPFELSKPPLIRVGIIENGPSDCTLLVDMHHIISDGVSQDIMINDFITLYNDQPLSPLPLQYRDYAEWQHSTAHLQQIAKQREFWLHEFSDEIRSLDLPKDYARPAVKNYDGHTLDFSLDEQETRQLKALAASEQATVFMVLIAIYTIFLSKLSNQEDIVTGIPVAGRSHADLDNIIGMFVNMLPVRNYPEGHLHFRDYLAIVKSKLLNCLENQSYQYEELIDELKLSRNLSRNPLFDAAFVFQNFEQSDLTLPGITVRRHRYVKTVSIFDITLLAVEHNHRLYLSFQYSAELFKKETIERFIACFKQIVSEIITQPAIKIASIFMVPDAERQRMLHTFNDYKAYYPADKPVIALFEERVRQIPDHTAIVYGNERMSYRQLNDKANAIAARIMQQLPPTNGMAKRIGLLFHPAIEMIAAILGILRSGCAYVPLSPDVSAIRNQYILSDCQAQLVLVQESICLHDAEKVSFVDKDRMIVVQPGSEATDSSLTALRNQSVDDPMYIIYTSGTTGMPKGVEILNTGVLNMIFAYKRLFKITEGMHISQVANICFDASVFEMWPSLVVGACLYIAPAETRVDPIAMENWLIDNKIEISFQPPVIAEYLLKKGHKINHSDIKILQVAGDRFDYRPSEKMPFRIYNLYGPTEDTVWTTWWELRHDQEQQGYCIGWPVANKRIYILNKYGSLQPIGVSGELCIAGDGLATGYINNEKLTAEKFQPASVNGERIYKTGDLARWLPDGTIEFLGRIDNQVKIRGIRIEPDEIKIQLAKHALVKDCIVVVMEQLNEKYIVAYYVSDEEINSNQLRVHLAKNLPDYMIPAWFVKLEAIPVTPYGKPDRKALPVPGIDAGEDHVPPSNELEKKLVAIWAELLGLDEQKISVNNSFFELGGHSLTAPVLIAAIRRELNVSLHLKDLFQYQSIATMALHLQMTV